MINLSDSIWFFISIMLLPNSKRACSRGKLSKSTTADPPFFRRWQNTTDSVSPSVLANRFDVADRFLKLLGTRTICRSISESRAGRHRWLTSWRHLEECSRNGLAVVWMQQTTKYCLDLLNKVHIFRLKIMSEKIEI